ncbi:hypothetical protein H632_c84p1 [Helicosporidium sp. ATCC 50920]|nr:hypothetical protein H632_c84p1 [Helicosporidium sp. ATCC 50920]|eukprot:KDD76859.1 hypothetical protein H632_c84p1 [Helicosporidium sp. ATCC 50920]
MPHDPNASSALTLTRPTQLDIFVHCGGAMAQVATRLADGPLQWEQPLEVEDLEDLYAWIDTVPLSKPKRAFARDFSDGVLTAEIIHYYFPRMVELHNYKYACRCPAS